MITINKEELKRKLINIYQKYVDDENSENLRRDVFQTYLYYSSSFPVLDKKIAIALNKLVDLYENTGVAVSKEEAMKILEDLKTLDF